MDAAREDLTPVQVEFKGNAREWFGIWIVNLVLSILTIGIYSAWAKVRQKKYFYQHTFVGGRNFDYHATGKQILIGRIIVIVGLVVFSVLSAIPLLGILLLLVLFALLPWLAVKSLSFNARMSSWSNVRFSFRGTYGGAVKVLLLFPFLAVLTLYLAMPFATRARHRYVIGRHALGKTPFAFDAPISKFYVAVLAGIGWLLFFGAIIGGAVFVTMGDALLSALPDPEGTTDPAAEMTFIFGIYAFMLVLFIPAGALYFAMVRNILFNNTVLGNVHRFRSTVPPLGYVWLIVSNAVAIVCTLGLLLPWAQVRKADFLARYTTLLVGGSLDGFVGDMTDERNAIGDAYGDIEGLDLDVGI